MSIKSQFEIDVKTELMKRGYTISQLCKEIACSRQALYDVFNGTCKGESQVKENVIKYLNL